MESINVQIQEYHRLGYTNISNKEYDVKNDDGDVYIILDNGAKSYFLENMPILDFYRYKAPYLETKLTVRPAGYRMYLNYTIKIKNLPRILDSLNHDYILRSRILDKWDYKKHTLTNKFTDIETSIYKSKIKINPSKNVKLFDYQINNIEIMRRAVKGPFSVSSSDKKFKLLDTPETEHPNSYVYFDNFKSRFTFEESSIKYKTRGGIIADEMGLGKTVTTISYLKMVPSTKPDSKKLKAKGHLIIVPSHLAKQWKSEIEKVWEDAEVKMILTKRDHLSVTTKDILDYDFVIVSQQFLVNKSYYMKYPNYNCTPSTFRIDYKISKFINEDKSIKVKDIINKPPLLELITWNNVVLDEGHEIMSGGFGSSHTISQVLFDTIKEMKGKNYWYVSGTPFYCKNGYTRILNFLKVKIFQHGKFIHWFSSEFRNIAYTNRFMRNILVRHTKKQVEEQIDLKGLDEKVYWLEQTPTEKQIYNGSKNRGRYYLLKLCCHLMVADFNSAMKIQTVDIETVKINIIKQSEDRIKKYTSYIEKLNPANQSYHMLKANYTQIVSQAKFMLESIKKLDKKEDKKDEECEEDECPICLGEIEQPTILPCGHIFCYDCIKEMTCVKKQCPLCKQTIKGDLIKVADKKNEKKEEKQDDLIEKYGVKTGTIIRMVRKLTANTENNIIIFSQYDFMLKLISDSLSQNGVNNSFVKGNVFQRSKAIESFRGLRMGESSQVIMLSLKNAASGTHLVEANHIIFVDPVDSYRDEVRAIENQAVARAFRIGQKRKVHIHRLLVKDTVEEEIYKKVYL